MNHPMLSVIVPGHNCSGTIKACLSSIRAQDWPKDRIEILYVDDASLDDSAAIAAEVADQQLKHLQQALLNDENALLHQMMITALEKLQEYVDYLAAQDNLQALKKVTKTLAAEDHDFFERPDNDFADLTRTLRISDMSAHIESSAIFEKNPTDLEKSGWQPFWSDLRENSELGQLLASYATPAMFAEFFPQENHDHEFLLRYLSKERDGIHMEAYCTCGKNFVEVGEDETQVLEVLWGEYRQHYEAKNIAGRLLRNWSNARNNPIRRYYRS